MLKLSGGKSEKDRISFYTNSDGATAIRKENGEIYFKYGKKKIGNFKGFITILCIILLLKSFVIIPQIRNNSIDIIWYFIPTFFYIFLTLFSIIFVRITGGKEFLRNHAAEHMTFAAYKKLKRIPTVREIKRFSRINRNCGISFYSALITGQIIGFIAFFYGNIKIPEILLFIIPLIFANIFPFCTLGKFCQFFTTSKPREENIELALAALKALENPRLSTFSWLFEDAFDKVLNEDYPKNLFDESFED